MKLFISLLFVSLLVACSLDKEQRKRANQMQPELPEQIADSVAITYSEQGEIKAKLNAPKLVMKEGRTESFNEFPEGLHMIFFNKEGEKNADLYANYGYDDQQKRERYVRDSVKIITKDGEVFTTDELYIDEAKDSVHNNNQYVKITRPNGTIIQGEGFVSNTRLEPIRILRTRNSQVVLEEDQTIN